MAKKKSINDPRIKDKIKKQKEELRELEKKIADEKKEDAKYLTKMVKAIKAYYPDKTNKQIMELFEKMLQEKASQDTQD